MYLICAGVIALLAILNLADVRALGLMTSDPALLPVPVQVSWAVLCILGIIWVRFLGTPRKALVYWSLAFLLIGSVPVFYSHNPALHGDGNYGAPPIHPPFKPAFRPDGESGPKSQNHKLKAFLNYGLAKILPNKVLVPYTVGMPEWPNRHETFARYREAKAPLLNAWRLISMVAGLSIAALLAWALYRLPQEWDVRVGALLLAMASPVMLNSYGHFDNYALDVLMISGWFIAAWRLSQKVTWQRLAATAVILALLLWNHFFGVFLVGATGLLLGIGWWERSGRRWPVLGTVSLAVLLGLLPLITGKGGNEVLIAPGHAEQFGQSAVYQYALVDQSLLLLRISLPALLLAGYLLYRWRRNRIPLTPLEQGALFLVVGGCVGMYTLNFLLGIADELNMAVLGAFILGGAIVLALWLKVEARAFLYAGLVSLYMFVPCLFVYADQNLMFEHFRRTIPYSRCGYNLSFSPFVTFGLRCPAETDADQERLLSIYRDGLVNTQPIWRQYNELCRIYLTSWAYEFGRTEEAQKQQLWYFSNNVNGLFDLWQKGSRFTDRHDNLAYRRSRAFSRKVLEDTVKGTPDHPTAKRLLEILDEFEARDRQAAAPVAAK